MLNPKEPTRTRLRAALQQTKLLGLAQPDKIAVGTPQDWREEVKDVPKEQLEALILLRERLRGPTPN